MHLKEEKVIIRNEQNERVCDAQKNQDGEIILEMKNKTKKKISLSCLEKQLVGL